MRTFFVTFLRAGDAPGSVDWAEVHADTVGQVAEVAVNHGWRIMSLHDTACWRPKLKAETLKRLEVLELERFLHYQRRGRRQDPAWLGRVHERRAALCRELDGR